MWATSGALLLNIGEMRFCCVGLLCTHAVGGQHTDFRARSLGLEPALPFPGYEVSGR